MVSQASTFVQKLLCHLDLQNLLGCLFLDRTPPTVVAELLSSPLLFHAPVPVATSKASFLVPSSGLFVLGDVPSIVS